MSDLPSQLLSGGGLKDFDLKNQPAFAAGKKTVTTAGTAEQLSSQAVPDGFEVVIKALAGNATNVHVAKSKTDAETDADAYELAAGETIGLKVQNTDDIWVDVNTSGEGVTFAVETES